MSYIVYSSDNGGIGVSIVAPGADPLAVAAVVVPAGTAYKILEKINIDPDFFGAYEFVSGKVKLNVSKAKEIQKNRWRALRKTRFAELDTAYLVSLEQKGTTLKNKIVALKAELRNVTETDLPDDFEGIKNTWPGCLTAPL